MFGDQMRPRQVKTMLSEKRLINSAEPIHIEGLSTAMSAEMKIGLLVDRLARVGQAEQTAVAGLAEQLYEMRQLIGSRGSTAVKSVNAAVAGALAKPIDERQLGSVTELAGVLEQPLDMSRATRAELPIGFDAYGITGFLEAISPALRGWACSQSPDICLSVALYQDERLVGIARASESREDLVKAGHQGARAFAVPVPEALFDGKFHEIDLRIAGTAQSLFSRPLMVGLDSASQSTVADIPADGIAGSTTAWLVFMDSADGSDTPLRHASDEAARLPSTTHANGIANAEQLYAREDLELLAQSGLMSMAASDSLRDGIASTLAELAQRVQRLRLVLDEIEEAVYRSGGPADLGTPISH